MLMLMLNVNPVFTVSSLHGSNNVACNYELFLFHMNEHLYPGLENPELIESAYSGSPGSPIQREMKLSGDTGCCSPRLCICIWFFLHPILLLITHCHPQTLTTQEIKTEETKTKVKKHPVGITQLPVKETT